MTMLGWCMTGFHEGRVLRGPGKTCPGTAQGIKGRTLTCTCWCHGGSDADETPLRETDPDDADGDLPVSEGGGEADVFLAPPGEG